MSDGGQGTKGALTCAPAGGVLIGLTLACLLAAKPAAAEFVAFPGRFASQGAPPLMLARSHPAAAVPPRVLSVRFTRERYRHSSRALDASDPAIMALASVLVARNEFELGYGLGHGLSGRARFGWASFSPGDESLSPPGGGGREVGFGDLELALSGAHHVSERLTARVEGTMSLPTGDGTAYDNGSGLSLTPFTSGKVAFSGGGAVTMALANAAAPVAVHLHAEGMFVGRPSPEAGEASVPFPDRFPLVTLGPEAHDRLDLRFAIAMSRPSAVLLAEVDWPLLLDAGDLITLREAPLTLSPGFALRLGVLEVGVQVDLPLASDHGDTAFDPHMAYPDWGLRLRLGTDLLPHDRDGDRDGVGDLTDGCPGDPEDQDGFADGDGCPDADNDGDLIADLRDACPEAAEDRDGFADEDGCPDLDNDGDGIPDSTDLCPTSAEDRDGVDDQDGCPEREMESAEEAEPEAASEEEPSEEAAPGPAPAPAPPPKPQFEEWR
jgi:hypothetical protein